MTNSDQIKRRRPHTRWESITRADLEQIRIETEREVSEMEQKESDQIAAALAYMKRIEADPENGPATSGMPLLAEDYERQREEIERLKAQLVSIKTEVGYYYDDVYPERTLLRRICKIVESKQESLKPNE